MKKKIEDISLRIWSAIRSNPVEMFLAALVCFLNIYRYEIGEVYLYDLLFYYFPALFLFSYMLNLRFRAGRLRLIYYASLLVCPLLMWIPDRWSWSATYIVTLVVTQLVYLASGWQQDNKAFMGEALRYLRNLLFSAALSIIVWLLSLSVYVCISYIFDVWESENNNIYMYIPSVAFMGVMPLLFLMFDREKEEEGKWESRLLEVLLNYVLSPVLLIYAVILYLYFIKIAIQWSLPKGAVAYIVMSFTTATFVLKGCQVFLSRRSYDWLYRYASLVVMPALVMFWIGALYRIREYGFTEPRVYLVVVGLILTATALMFLSKRWGRYLYVVCLAIGLLVGVTYIPGITAGDIERFSQAGRENLPKEVEMAYKTIDFTSISSDRSIDIAGYSSMEKLGFPENKGKQVYLHFENDTLSIYDRDGSLLYNKSGDEFLDSQLMKVGLTRRDSIPDSSYLDLLQLDLDSGKVVFETMGIRKDSLSHLYYVYGDYYLKR